MGEENPTSASAPSLHFRSSPSVLNLTTYGEQEREPARRPERQPSVFAPIISGVLSTSVHLRKRESKGHSYLAGGGGRIQSQLSLTKYALPVTTMKNGRLESVSH